MQGINSKEAVSGVRGCLWEHSVLSIQFSINQKLL